jgi:2-haloacid dehalogenase
VADDAGIGQELASLAGVYFAIFLRIEAVIGLAIVLALAQHGDPRKAGLAAFQRQELEQRVVVLERATPIRCHGISRKADRRTPSRIAACRRCLSPCWVWWPCADPTQAHRRTPHCRPTEETPMAQVPADLKVCIFDVFGTVVDWRGSLIQDLPGLGKKYGMDTDWTSFADDWRGLYQPQMTRVRKGELPWTRIDDLHKEAFEMLLKKRSLKHPGEAGAWEFTHLWHKLRPWPDSNEGIGMMKKKYVVATLSNGNVALLINMARHSGIPWDHCFSGETFKHYKPDPESYLGVVDSMYLKPHQVMLCAAHNGDLAAAQKCGLSTGFVIRPNEHGPGQKRDLKPEGDWDAVGNTIVELAKKIGA